MGINYWPARTAMRWWQQFDRAEVVRDFARISAAGFDSVRMFLLWEAFQPEPGRVDPEMLHRLVEVADAAAEVRLQIMPTLFTGHMSGVNWIPGWALGGTERDARFRVVTDGRVVADGLRNWYADPGVTGAQALLAGEAAAALAGHDALWAWDLGNENSNCTRPPDRGSGLRWLETMTGAIRAADPRALITTGLHMEDLEEDRNLGPREVAASCDLLTMHGYPVYADWAEGGTDAHLVPFLARVTRWLAGGKDVLFSEFGLPTVRQSGPTGAGAGPGPDPAPPLVEELEAAGYTSEVLTGLREAGCTGAMLWCYADYAPAAWDRPPLDLAVHERSFGLWRADGTPKPAVAAVAAAAGSPRREPPADDWIDIDQDTFWQAPGTQLPRLYRRYRSRDPG